MMPMAYESPKSKNATAENLEIDGGKPIFAIMSSKNFSNCSDQKLSPDSDKFDNQKHEQMGDILNSNEECQI